MDKKINLILLVIAIIVGFWAFGTFDKKEPVNQEKEKVQMPKELVASGHPAWPPIMYQQDDLIVGAGPEIVKKVFADLGINVVSPYEGLWDVVQEKAKSGEVDVLAAAYKTTEREAYMDYSIPYTIDPIVLVVKKGKTFPYSKWEDLIGKKGVVTIGDSYGQEFDQFVKEKLSPKQVATPEEAFALIKSGEADYFVYALYSAENYIFQNQLANQAEIIPQYVSTENFYLTISKKSPFVNLMPQVNDLLEKYKSDGTIDQIIKNNKQLLWGSEATK